MGCAFRSSLPPQILKLGDTERLKDVFKKNTAVNGRNNRSEKSAHPPDCYPHK